jgi:ribosomal protein S12 methylthiotransferase accessory factor
VLLLDATRPTPLAASLPRLRTLVSPYTGIVQRAIEIMHAPDDARMFHVAALTSNGRGVIGENANRYNGGMNDTFDRAFAAAVGETAERYSAAYVPEHDLVLAAAKDLAQPHVDPARVELFSEEQYRLRPVYGRFDDETRVRWVRGVRLPDGEPTWLPAQLVYLNDSIGAGEARIAYSSSSGLACGATFAEALLGALYELVERDAFMITWYAKLSLPRLDWSGDPAIVALERRFFAETLVDYEAVDLSSFFDVPTVLIVTHDRSDFVSLSVGAASARTIGEAWSKAMREAFQTHAFARQLRLSDPNWSCRDDFADVLTMEDHVLAYTFAGFARHAKFLTESERRHGVAAVPPLSGESIPAQIEALVSRLAARGVDVYAADVTSPDIRAAGLRVVRAFSPQLARLDTPYPHRFLGVRRLYEAAHAAGLLDRVLTPGELNPAPHPFP